MIDCNGTTQVEFAGKTGDNSSWPEAQGCPASGFLFTMAFDRFFFFEGYTIRSSQETLMPNTFFNPLRVPMLMMLRWRLRPSGC